MTPQEKAKELVDKYFYFGDQEFDYSKEFALIALEFANEFADDSYRSCYGYKNTLEYLKIVKQEIETI